MIAFKLRVRCLPGIGVNCRCLMQTLHHANARMTAPRIATSSPPILHVTVEGIGLVSKHFQFTKPFRIGRSEECEICVKDDHVSRRHAEVTLEEGTWCIRDLNSSNGLYAGGSTI